MSRNTYRATHRDLKGATETEPKAFETPPSVSLKGNLIMNAKQTFVAIAATLTLAAGSAFAQEATPDTWLQAAATKTRADVSAELVQARASGLTRSWSAGYIEPVKSVLSREAVRAETARAIRSGELDAINGEVYAFEPAHPVRVAAK
jgi:Domain of unknown function (DUF4148)